MLSDNDYFFSQPDNNGDTKSPEWWQNCFGGSLFLVIVSMAFLFIYMAIAGFASYF